jgi:glutathione synthase/RimK-type ligase-like ATP-grasp enzyme
VSITLGIHPDHVQHANGELQSFSDRWGDLARARGFSVLQVSSQSACFLQDLARCDGFMWRIGYSTSDIHRGKLLISALEHVTDMRVFPSSRTLWHFEDKIAQLYLMVLAGLPTARTQVFWNAADALAYCASASYPFVVKLARGMKSKNVTMVQTLAEAEAIVERMFGSGLTTLRPSSRLVGRLAGRHALALKLLSGGPLPGSVQTGYFYAQEFIPGNDCDTRVTVIGDRAFAFRRFNRPNDFRASGSGRIDWEPAAISPDALTLAFDVADRLGTQSIALDILRKDGSPVIVEISYTYATWAIRDCPGHWVRRGTGTDRRLEWVAGRTLAEDAIFEDFAAGW